MGGQYNQGQNQGEKDTSVILENKESVVKKDFFVNDEDVVKLENQKCDAKMESLEDIKKDIIEISSEDDCIIVEPSKETKLKTYRVRGRGPRSYRKRVRRLKYKGIAADIAQKLADMTPKQMVEFVKHDISDLTRVKSFLEDVQRKRLKKRPRILPQIWEDLRSRNNFFTFRGINNTPQNQTNNQPVTLKIYNEVIPLDKRQMNIIRCCLVKGIVLTEKSMRPKIISWSFEYNHIEVRCANMKSKLWVERHVRQLKPWPNAKLSTEVERSTVKIWHRGIISKAPKGVAAKTSASSINDEKIPKSEYNDFVQDCKDIQLSLSTEKVDKAESTSNTVGNVNNMSMLNVTEFGNIKSEGATSESLTIDDVKHTITGNSLASNTKTNITITNSSDRDKKTVNNDILWETNVKDSTIVEFPRSETLTPKSVLNPLAITNITVTHEKLSGAQKQKRKRAIEAMQNKATNKKTDGDRKEVAENVVHIKNCNNPVYTEAITKVNIENTKSVEINNFNTEKIQSLLNIQMNSNKCDTLRPAISKRKRKNKRQRLRLKQRSLNKIDSLDVKVGDNKSRPSDGSDDPNLDAGSSKTDSGKYVTNTNIETTEPNNDKGSHENKNQANSHKNKHTNVIDINKDTNAENIIVLSDDDTPVSKRKVKNMPGKKAEVPDFQKEAYEKKLQQLSRQYARFKRNCGFE